MKSSELRVNNYVVKDLSIDDLEEIIVKPYDLLSNDVLENLFPIKLTKEWLLVFGFVQDKIDKSFVLNSFSIFLDKRIKDNIYLKSIDGFGNFTWNAASGLKVQYVHQLQNLYFALTNEELKIN